MTTQVRTLESAPRALAQRAASLDLGKYGGVMIGLVAMVVFLALTQQGFLAPGNIMNILHTNAALLVCSVGMTFVVLLGGFDLSVGAFLALGGVILAKLVEGGLPPLAAIALVLLGGLVASLLTNAGLIAFLGLNFFVVTIATNALFGGLALVVSDGRTVSLYDDAFIVGLGTGTFAGVPLTVIVAVSVAIVAGLILRQTGFGRMIYAVGGNAEAARLSGINVIAVRVVAYLLCSACAVLAGIVMASRLQSASPTMGAGIALMAAAAVLLGGTSFLGGEGGILGTVIGVLFLGVLSNGLTLVGVSGFWQGVITGAVLLGAITSDWLRSRLALRTRRSPQS
ncbi:ABC transporter permease [Microbacterium hydrocarbonoxydans]|uniref:ABC transporter permease n=1 Tax=Microbacterium hydrocarbonoxydans TaxID=273678 RepID=UPI003D999F0D